MDHSFTAAHKPYILPDKVRNRLVVKVCNYTNGIFYYLFILLLS